MRAAPVAFLTVVRYLPILVNPIAFFTVAQYLTVPLARAAVTTAVRHRPPFASGQVFEATTKGEGLRRRAGETTAALQVNG
jgi:hypothetical protein